MAERKRRAESDKKKRERIKSDGLKKEQKKKSGGGGGRGAEEAILTRVEGMVNLLYWNPWMGRGRKARKSMDILEQSHDMVSSCLAHSLQEINDGTPPCSSSSISCRPFVRHNNDITVAGVAPLT